MSQAIAKIAIGVAAIAADFILPGIGVALSASVMTALATAGASMILGGLGTLLSGQQQGLSSTTRNPIQPWNVIYGQAHVGGTVVFIEETGDSDKYLHQIYVLACHPCSSIDAVLFDNKRVILSHTTTTTWDSTTTGQTTVSISTIHRDGAGIVYVTLAAPINGLFPGDTIAISGISTDATLNGEYQVTPSDSTHFTYICGGSTVTITGQGSAETTWPDYKDTIHAEIALGAQTSNPFPGLTSGGGSGSNGLWTNDHALQGLTAIYLRLKWDKNVYTSGIPNISFLVSGKSVYDPRTGTTGYTPNAALCIADFLCQQDWGFKLNYGTDVPISQLIAAANICDESVAMANGFNEPRYACNGSFQVSAKRGEILQNLLTSCAGRLTYAGGIYQIWPGAWYGAYAINPNLYLDGLVGAFTDGSGHVIEPIYIGNGGTFTAPTGTVQLQLGVNDDTYDDNGGSWVISVNGTNYTVPGTTAPWISGGSFTIGQDSSKTAPVVVSGITPGSTVTVAYVSGSVTDAGHTFDANGITSILYNDIGFLGLPVPAAYMVASFTGSGTPPTITDAYLAGPYQWKPKAAVRDLYNGVKGTYTCPTNNWQPADMPPYAQDADHGYGSDANLAADGGERRWLDLQFPFTISLPCAQRLAKIELLRRRFQGTGTFSFNLAMYQTTTLDIVAFNLPTLGWTNKLLEITSHRFTVNKQSGEDGREAMLLGTEIDVQETDPSIYTWSTTEELQATGSRGPGTSGSTQTIATPSGVTSANSTVAGTGITTGQIQVSWTAPTDAWVTDGGQSVVQYSLDNVNWIPLGTFDSSATTAYIPQVAAGQSYWTRVAFINVAGVQSDWTETGPLTATGASMRRIDDETPSGTINGTNTAFTLSHSPNPATSLALYANGDLQLQGLDYTLSGATITMTSAPKTGWWLRAFYWY